MKNLKIEKMLDQIEVNVEHIKMIMLEDFKIPFEKEDFQDIEDVRSKLSVIKTRFDEFINRDFRITKWLNEYEEEYDCINYRYYTDNLTEDEIDYMTDHLLHPDDVDTWIKIKEGVDKRIDFDTAKKIDEILCNAGIELIY